MSRALYERLCDINERCEQLVEDLNGDLTAVADNRILAKAVLYDLHVIGEACGALPDDFKARHPEVDWKGWKDFRNLTTHVYWRADATIAAEAMERAIRSWLPLSPRNCQRRPSRRASIPPHPS